MRLNIMISIILVCVVVGVGVVVLDNVQEYNDDCDKAFGVGYWVNEQIECDGIFNCYPDNYYCVYNGSTINET